MTATELLDKLSRNEIYLWAEEGKLRFRAPPNALTGSLRQQIKAHRQDLLWLLGDGSPGGGTSAAKHHIVPAPDDLGEPFPLTEVQQAYWLGSRSTFALATSAQLYLEIDTPPLEPEHLEKAWQRLIDEHPMLRTVVLEDAQQQVLTSVPPYILPVTDLRQTSHLEVNDRLDETRRNLAQRDVDAHRWPLFELHLSRAMGFDRVHLSISLLICDAISWRILLRQMTQLYFDQAAPLPELELSFRDYVLAQKSSQEAGEDCAALDYWRQRLPSLPTAPKLPLKCDPREVTKPKFVRREASLDAERWQRLQDRARLLGATPTAVLTTAYALMLALWSRQRHFLLNLLFFNRRPWHAEVDQVVGNFSSTILFEVDLRESASFADAVRQLQRQLLRDLEHADISGVRVLREHQAQHGAGQRLTAPVVLASTLNLGDGVPPDPADSASDQDESGEDGPGEDGDAITIKVAYSSLQTPQVWLDHQVTERDGRLHFHWDAVAQLFARGEVRKRFEEYFELLWQLSDEQDLSASPIEEWLGAAWQEPAEVGESSGSEPEADMLVEHDYVPPRDALEERLVAIWQQLLGVTEVGVRDDFFELGGQSLLAVRMVGRLREDLGRDVPLAILFEGGTIEELAAALRRFSE